MTMRALALLLSGLLALPAGADTFSCLDYGPTRMVGTLVRQTYAGPPDYESVTKGDAPLVVWILQLDQRICVNANTRYPREPTQIEIEVAVNDRQFTRYSHLLGQKVAVSGELIHGGAKYQKRLVLTASDIERTRPTR